MGNDRRKDRRREIGARRAEEFSFRNVLYIIGIILALGLIAFFVTMTIYNNNLEKIYSDLEPSKSIGETQTNENSEENKTEEASTQIGKTVEELENQEVRIKHRK